MDFPIPVGPVAFLSPRPAVFRALGPSRDPNCPGSGGRPPRAPSWPGVRSHRKSIWKPCPFFRQNPKTKEHNNPLPNEYADVFSLISMIIIYIVQIYYPYPIISIYNCKPCDIFPENSNVLRSSLLVFLMYHSPTVPPFLEKPWVKTHHIYD